MAAKLPIFEHKSLCVLWLACGLLPSEIATAQEVVSPRQGAVSSGALNAAILSPVEIAVLARVLAPFALKLLPRGCITVSVPQTTRENLWGCAYTPGIVIFPGRARMLGDHDGPNRRAGNSLQYRGGAPERQRSSARPGCECERDERGLHPGSPISGSFWQLGCEPSRRIQREARSAYLRRTCRLNYDERYALGGAPHCADRRCAVVQC